MPRRGPLEDDIIVPHLKDADPHPQYAKKGESGAGVALSDDVPATEVVGGSGVAGKATKASRSDHRHALPGIASALADGFMSKADKIRLDSLVSSSGGGTWYAGTGAPASTLGTSGDKYFNSATADVWVNQMGSWSLAINLIGTWLAAIATSGSGADLAAASVTLGKIATIANATILGNNTGSPASPVALTPTQVKALLAITSSDVSGLAAIATSGSGADLVANSVALGKLATIAAKTLLGNNTAGTGTPSALTAAQVAAMLADWNAQLLYDFDANVVADATTGVTLSATHRGAVLRLDSGSAVTVTLPNSLEVGYSVTVVQEGAGQATFSPAAGATLNNRLGYTKTAGQYAMVTLLVVSNAGGSSAVWVLAGDAA